MSDPIRPPDWKPLVREVAAETAKPGRKTGRRSILDYAAEPGNDPRTLQARAWRAEFIARMEAGDTDTNVCAVMMTGVATFYRWLQEGADREPSEAEPKGHKGRSPYREFLEDVTRAKSVTRSNHILTIARAASEGDWRASKYWLSCRFPMEFSERVVVENRHTNATGVGPVAVTTATPAELVAAVLAVPPEDRVRLAGLVTDDLAPEEGGGGAS